MKKLRHQQISIVLTSILVSFTCTPAWSNAIVNGDFASGDFTGWTVSAFDDTFTPIDATPFIGITPTASGDQAADFTTGAFSDGLFFSVLEQTFTVDPAEPILRFEFSLPNVQDDPSGTGSSPFFDSFLVSLDNGADFYEVFFADQFVQLADPFGTASGPVSLGVSTNPDFDFTIAADLSSLVGDTLNLAFITSNEDDQSSISLQLGFVETTSSPLVRPVPEPNPLLLIATAVILFKILQILKFKQIGD